MSVVVAQTEHLLRGSMVRRNLSVGTRVEMAEALRVGVVGCELVSPSRRGFEGVGRRWVVFVRRSIAGIDSSEFLELFDTVFF